MRKHTRSFLIPIPSLLPTPTFRSFRYSSKIENVLKKSYLHCTHGITPKRIARGEAYLCSLAPVQHNSEERLQLLATLRRVSAGKGKLFTRRARFGKTVEAAGSRLIGKQGEDLFILRSRSTYECDLQNKSCGLFFKKSLSSIISKGKKRFSA